MKNWNQHFKQAVPLKLYVMHTGYVHMSGNIHFNKKDSRFKAMPKDTRFNPVFSYLVDHPEHGLLLIDTGLHPSFADKKTGNFGMLLGGMVKTKTEKGMDVASRIRAMNKSLSDVKNVILSHLHLDHPSGLPVFRGPQAPVVHLDEKEAKAGFSALGMFKGYIKSHLKGFDLRFFNYTDMIDPFENVCDFFGDGSVMVLSTPGHSPGHASTLLNAVEGPVLLTFDAAHRRHNAELGLPPIGDYQAALKSIKNIQLMIEAFPSMRVIYGHDPDQLDELTLAPEYYK